MRVAVLQGPQNFIPEVNVVCNYEIQVLPTDCLPLVRHGGPGLYERQAAHICQVDRIQIITNLIEVFSLDSRNSSLGLDTLLFNIYFQTLRIFFL